MDLCWVVPCTSCWQPFFLCERVQSTSLVQQNAAATRCGPSTLTLHSYMLVTGVCCLRHLECNALIYVPLKISWHQEIGLYFKHFFAMELAPLYSLQFLLHFLAFLGLHIFLSLLYFKYSCLVLSYMFSTTVVFPCWSWSTLTHCAGVCVPGQIPAVLFSLCLNMRIVLPVLVYLI